MKSFNYPQTIKFNGMVYSFKKITCKGKKAHYLDSKGRRLIYQP